MTIAMPPAAPALLTYEEYMTEGEVPGHYEIIEGVRYFMSGASWPHQRKVFHTAKLLDNYAETTGSGVVLTAPFDVLIRRTPRLQTRQPDVFFITHARLAQGGGVPQQGVLQVAPELVVEVISDNDRQRDISARMEDYAEIGIAECWHLYPDSRAVQVWQWIAGNFVLAATYDDIQMLQSVTFSDLTLPVAAMFRA